MRNILTRTASSESNRLNRSLRRRLSLLLIECCDKARACMWRIVCIVSRNVHTLNPHGDSPLRLGYRIRSG